MKSVIAALLLFFLAWSQVALAQAPVPATGEVVGVRVEGTRRIEADTVLANVGLRRGDSLSPYKVRRDLKAVYATGFFDDVRIELFPDDDGGVQVVFMVTEKPAVRDVRIEGAKKIDEEELRDVLDIRAFSVLNDAEVRENVKRMRDLYIEKGYYLAEITPEVTTVGDEQVELVFQIDEHRKVIVQSIEFSGNDHVPASKIKRLMQLKEGGIVPWLTGSGAFRRDYLESDSYLIRSVFLEEGYVDVQVDPARVYLSPDKRFIYIHFHVDEGEHYELGAIAVDGDFEPELGLSHEAVVDIVDGTAAFDVQEEQWREAEGRRGPLIEFPTRGPRLREGDDFKLSTLQLVMQSVQDFYSDQGYAHASVIPETQTDPETRRVDVTLVVDKGERYRIGQINITGNDPTFDKVVRRELLVDEGDVFRGSRLKASRARLERLGYFDEIAISTPRGAGEDVMDVNIKVSEQPTGSFSLGLGYSNYESFVLTGNISKNNFLGLGYVMSAAINWSGIRRQGNVSIFDPYFLDTRWTLRVNGYSIARQFQLNEYQRGGSLEIGRYLDARDDWRLSAEYTIEDVGLTYLDAFRQRMLGGELYRNGLTSTLGLSLNVDKRNNRINATKGVYASLSTALSGGFRTGDDKVLAILGGEFNFIESKANIRIYQPLIPHSDMLVLRINSTLGAIQSTDGRVVPFIHRYRAGGINSVRGFNWFSLGPTIRSPGWGGSPDDPVQADDELIVGGTEIWVNNIEIESPVVRQAGISAVVFFDAGNAFGDPWGHGHVDPRGLRTSVGAGVRWRSPMGPLRFEYGFPLRPQEGERRAVFDFSIGSFF